MRKLPFAPMRRRHALATLGLFVLPLAGALPASADTLLVDAVKDEQATATDRPPRGMLMKTVESRYGAPLTREAPVGKPPITRWDYADYSVFFEYQHVIHAVPKRGG